MPVNPESSQAIGVIHNSRASSGGSTEFNPAARAQLLTPSAPPTGPGDAEMSWYLKTVRLACGCGRRQSVRDLAVSERRGRSSFDYLADTLAGGDRETTPPGRGEAVVKKERSGTLRAACPLPLPTSR